MAGGKRLGVGEVTLRDLRGQELINALSEELTGDHAANEGSLEDNAETSDKDTKTDNIGK